MKEIENNDKKTPFQKKLMKIFVILTMIVWIVGFIWSCTQFFTNVTIDGSDFSFLAMIVGIIGLFFTSLVVGIIWIIYAIINLIYKFLNKSKDKNNNSLQNNFNYKEEEVEVLSEKQILSKDNLSIEENNKKINDSEKNRFPKKISKILKVITIILAIIALVLVIFSIFVFCVIDGTSFLGSILILMNGVFFGGTIIFLNIIAIIIGIIWLVYWLISLVSKKYKE